MIPNRASARPKFRSVGCPTADATAGLNACDHIDATFRQLSPDYDRQWLRWLRWLLRPSDTRMAYHENYARTWDMIATGTPTGVGMAQGMFLRAEDVVARRSQASRLPPILILKGEKPADLLVVQPANSSWLSTSKPPRRHRIDAPFAASAHSRFWHEVWVASRGAYGCYQMSSGPKLGVHSERLRSILSHSRCETYRARLRLKKLEL